MPTYEYECRSCNNSTEELQKVDEKPLTLCPNCGENELFRIISGGLGFYLSNRTIGMIADKNEAKFSKDFQTHLKNKNKVAKTDKLSKKLPKGAEIQKATPATKKPWYKKNQTVSDNKLKSATPEQLKNYIEKGKL